MRTYKWQDYIDEALIKDVYPEDYQKLGEGLLELILPYISSERDKKTQYSEKDSILITYGDSIYKEGEKPLVTLKNFAEIYFKDCLSAIHLLPIYPYTSDDGFSVKDYKSIDPKLGDWEDIKAISLNFDLMLDAVINHISKESQWFKNYQNGVEPYTDFFFEKEEGFDVSQVIRPRALPLFHTYETHKGPKSLWTTFSEDQLDLNYSAYTLIIELAKVLLKYGDNGAKYIRLDAIGFAWKTSGTTCMHLPQTHKVIQLFRQLFDCCFDDVKLITETNVPHQDNISYFGNGYNEAHMVYQFPLPPLTFYTLITEDATYLLNWLSEIQPPSKETTFFNFLASHDGIGMRPMEGVLTEDEKQLMIDATLNNGGRINYKNNADGSQSAYELNINYMDALKSVDMDETTHIAKFIAAQAILISLQGVPGIYIHSLLGSWNWTEGVELSGINRRINRERLDMNQVVAELEGSGRRHQVYQKYTQLLNHRKQHKAFSPEANQEVIHVAPELFTILRKNKETILVMINIASKTVTTTNLKGYKGRNIITDERFDGNESVTVQPYEIMWIILD